MPHTIGIYLYDEVEVLDFAGPFEVFTTARRVKQRMQPDLPKAFTVALIGEATGEVVARGGLPVRVQYSIEDHPHLDVLLIPGGIVTAQLERGAVIRWIARTARSTKITASVCTGAFLLAKAGLLQSRRATTHWEDIPDLRRMFPDVLVQEEQRWIDTGEVITAAGISAGIDMSLHLVRRLEGEELAVRTARQMEYDWRNDGR